MKIPSWRRYRELLGTNPERDLSDEVRFHLETETEDLIASGLSAEEARRQAMARFGDVDGAIAACRESDQRRLGRRGRGVLFDALRQDARYAIRALRGRPGFAATVILILALGIGANAAVFSVVDPLFFRMPAGVRAPDEVKQIYVERQPKTGEPYFQARFSLPEARFIDSSITAGGLASAIFFRTDVDVEIAGAAAQPVTAGWVTAAYLTVLGVRPFAGTDFDEESARFGVPASTAIISWAFWQRNFGGDPRVLGQTIRVAGRPVTVRAIAPKGFAGIDLEQVDMWLPLQGFTGYRDVPGRPPWYESWGTIAFRLVARTPDGRAEQLVARVEAGVRAAADFIAANPRPGGRSARLVKAVPGSLLGALGPEGSTQGETIAAVLGALALLLLVMTTANVGNLLLGRAVSREREIAVRLALGMSKGRLVSQLTIESLVLALTATAAAVFAAAWIGAALRSMLLPGVKVAIGLFDTRVAVLALCLGLIVGAVAAIVPLATALRKSLLTTLRGTGRDGGGRHSRARAAMVGIQAALSVMLLVGTGLLARSLYNVRGIDLGLDIDRVITVTRPDSARGPTLEEIASLARGIPGVASVALSATQPLDDQFGARAFFTRDGDTLRTVGWSIGFVAAEPGYLDVVGTRVVRGRDLSTNDRLGAAPVMVVSEELARRVWPGRNPIGQCLRIERASAPCYTAVGVVQNAHSFHVVEEPKAVFYVTFDQRPDRTETAHAVLVRTSSGTRSIADRLRSMIGDTIASTRRRQVAIMKDMLATDYRPWELGARLFGGFAALALMLALFGLYGVLSYLVTLRSREIGVRMALGADRGRVLALVVGEGVRQVSIGAAVGLVITLILSTRIKSLLYQVSARDPVIAVSAVAVLIGCAALAALIPGRRAMAIDPMTAIREE